jgi:hypothetical protein
MDLQEMGLEVEWTDMVQDRENWRAVVKAVTNLGLP